MVCSILKTTAFLYFLILSTYSSFAGAMLAVKSGTSVDLSKFPSNQSKTAKFILVNMGNSKLIIDKIVNDCACASVDIGSKTIDSGKETILRVALKKNSLSGPFQKDIFIKSNSSKKLFKLTVKGNARPLYRVTPDPNKYIGHINLVSGYSCEFKLLTENTVVFDKPVVASRADTKSSLVSTGKNKWKLSVSLKGGKLGDSIDAKVKVPVLRPEGWPPVTVLLKGRWGIGIRAYPSKMMIPANMDAKIFRKFELKLSGCKNVDIKKITIRKEPGTKFWFRRSSQNKVSVSAEFMPGKLSIKKGEKLKFLIKYPGAIPTTVVFQAVSFVKK